MGWRARAAVGSCTALLMVFAHGFAHAIDEAEAWYIETKRAAKYARLAITSPAYRERLEHEDEAARHQLSKASALALSPEGRAVCQRAARAVVDFVAAARAGNMSNGPASFETQLVVWDHLSDRCIEGIRSTAVSRPPAISAIDLTRARDRLTRLPTTREDGGRAVLVRPRVQQLHSAMNATTTKLDSSLRFAFKGCAPDDASRCNYSGGDGIRIVATADEDSGPVAEIAAYMPSASESMVSAALLLEAFVATFSPELDPGWRASVVKKMLSDAAGPLRDGEMSTARVRYVLRPPDGADTRVYVRLNPGE
jgi:hypothetical protein